MIQGSIQLDTAAVASGNFCAQVDNNPLTLTGWNLAASKGGKSYPASFGFATTNIFSINTSSAGSNFSVTLDLSAQTGDKNYVCSCPAPLNPANPYLCRYTGVIAPSANVNFYLREGFGAQIEKKTQSAHPPRLASLVPNLSPRMGQSRHI
ncbi:MAG: hypothetical protein LC099_10325 [Anaerolineales bacterium]|nr:hypothetical protein [Anaerolineales bacterium]